MLQATEDAKKRIQRQKNKEDAADDEGEEWIDLGVKSDEALEIEKKKERMVAKAKGLGFRKFGKKKSGWWLDVVFTSSNKNNSFVPCGFFPSCLFVVVLAWF